MRYTDFFRQMTDVNPYPYQTRLGEDPWPDVLCIPTGLGKTAALSVAWLWKRLQGDAETPRRLVYCLPMRTLVEQTVGCVLTWVERAAKAFDDAGKPPPTVHVLMGGNVQDDWTMYPENPAILVGTQDMLLSRALMRGYAMSRYLWPVHFGLLHNDAMWVFDEVQLMGSGLATTAQLEAFRRFFGASIRSRSLWTSATLQLQWLMTVDFKEHTGNLVFHELGLNDRENHCVVQRLNAAKKLHRASTRLDKETMKKSSAPYAGSLAQEVVQAHQPGTTTLVMVNTVERAQKVMAAIEQCLKRQPKKFAGPEVLLVHSRFRSEERRRLHEALQKDPDPQGPGRIVVATQALEAGVDLTSRVLFTELAPWPSMVQRFGRCNRGGEWESAHVYWIDIDLEETSLAVPYDPKEMEEARERLKTLYDVSPSGLPPLADSICIRAVLRKRDLLDLFNTDPDLSGFDLDVSMYIRDADEADVQVFWRDLSSGWQEQPLPRPEELCRASLRQTREILRRVRRAEDQGPFVWDSLDGTWKRFQGPLRPGMVFMLGAKAGGYDTRMGLLPEAKEWVPCLSAPAVVPLEEVYESDPRSRLSLPIPLEQHLEDVFLAADHLCQIIGCPASEAEAVKRSAAWHDVGKSHPVFQATAHGVSLEEAADRKPLLAKSPVVGRHKRRHFRHELASVVAFLQHMNANPQEDMDVDLLAYLMAAHHGKVRISLRAMPDEEEPQAGYGPRFARGIWEGETLPPVFLPHGVQYPGGKIQLDIMELGQGFMGPSWTWRTERLLEKYGPFRLAWMETLVRIADWRASAEEQKGESMKSILALKGCRVVPLAHYLKGLGVFRLVSEFKDPEATARWQNEHLELESRLSNSDLESFFLEEYAPTPILAPWNKGSGFYPKDNKTGIESLRHSKAARFAPYREALEAAFDLKEQLKTLYEPEPTDNTKAFWLQHFRSELPETALPWLDAAVLLTTAKPQYPPLLGTGGNDGRLDFTNNFMQILTGELFDPRTGKALAPQVQCWLRAALFAETVSGMVGRAIGQFAPGNAGGPNASTGFEGQAVINPWDFVLMLEGAVLFAGAATRRLESSDTEALSYPFTVKTTSFGCGTGHVKDEASARAEIWVPLWERFLTLGEVQRLLKEGRVTVGRRPVRDGLDFARAVCGYGVERGITAFQRFAFLQRSGKAYLATPMGRVRVRRVPQVDLLHELEANKWLAQARSLARRENAPGRFLQWMRRLEEAVFQLTQGTGRRAVQEILICLGRIQWLLSKSVTYREALGPLPLLSESWVREADDGTSEFRLACALAGLSGMRRFLFGVEDKWGGTVASWVDPSRWTSADLVSNLVSLTERRFMTSAEFISPAGDPSHLFEAAALCDLSSVMAFLEGRTDDMRLALLIGALATARLPSDLPPCRSLDFQVPAVYMILKPFFTPRWMLRRLALLPPDTALPLPRELLRRLHSHHPPTLSMALREAWHRLRLAGVPLPRHPKDPPDAVPFRGPRLAAALVVPVLYSDLKRLYGSRMRPMGRLNINP